MILNVLAAVSYTHLFASWTEENGVTIATPVSGFFTSYYDDVTRLDFAAFLQYFPDDGTLSAGDEAEAAALAALPGYPWGISPGSVPIHRITRASVDAAPVSYTHLQHIPLIHRAQGHVPAVGGVVAVVAHDEDGALRHLHMGGVLVVGRGRHDLLGVDIGLVQHLSLIHI